MELLLLILVVVGVNLVATLIQKRYTDRELVKSLRGEIKKIQQQMKDAKKDTKKVNELVSRSLEIQGKLMNHTMKPMMISMLVFLPTIYVVREFFSGVSVALPLTLPLIGAQLGWLGIFIITGLVSNLIFRKVFDLGM